MAKAFRPVANTGNRVLQGPISQYEKPLLVWMAARIPAWVFPDHLTALGVVGALLTALGLIASDQSLSFLWLALAGLGLNWFGDSLDGTLARFRSIERPRYGFFVDYVADTVSQLLIAFGLGLSSFLRFDIACLTLVAYLILSNFTLLKLNVFGSMQLTYSGMGPTEVRFLLGTGMIIALLTETPFIVTPIGEISLFDGAALIIIAFGLGSALVMFVHDSARLSALDPPHTPTEVSMIEITESLPATGIPGFAAVKASGPGSSEGGGRVHGPPS